MERLIEFTPAFDKSHPDPAKNYGIGAVKIRFILKGAIGAVQFVVGTNWYLPHTQMDAKHRQFEHERVERFDTIQPEGWDLGYHADSKHPIREYHKEVAANKDDLIMSARECSYVPSGKCYYDGSSLNALELVPVLLNEGSEGIWKALEAYHLETFGAGDQGASTAIPSLEAPS